MEITKIQTGKTVNFKGNPEKSENTATKPEQKKNGGKLLALGAAAAATAGIVAIAIKAFKGKAKADDLKEVGEAIVKNTGEIEETITKNAEELKQIKIADEVARRAQAKTDIKRAQDVQEALFKAQYKATPKSARESAEAFIKENDVALKEGKLDVPFSDALTKRQETIIRANARTISESSREAEILRAQDIQEALFEAQYKTMPKSAKESAGVLESTSRKIIKYSEDGTSKTVTILSEDGSTLTREYHNGKITRITKSGDNGFEKIYRYNEDEKWRTVETKFTNGKEYFKVYDQGQLIREKKFDGSGYWSKEGIYKINPLGDETFYNKQGQLIYKRLADRSSKMYHENGRLMYETMSDGVSEGWYKNGIPHYKINKDGYAVAMYKNGQVKLIGYPDGTNEFFLPNGKNGTLDKLDSLVEEAEKEGEKIPLWPRIATRIDNDLLQHDDELFEGIDFYAWIGRKKLPEEIIGIAKGTKGCDGPFGPPPLAPNTVLVAKVSNGSFDLSSQMSDTVLNDWYLDYLSLCKKYNRVPCNFNHFVELCKRKHIDTRICFDDYLNSLKKKNEEEIVSLIKNHKKRAKLKNITNELDQSHIYEHDYAKA